MFCPTYTNTIYRHKRLQDDKLSVVGGACYIYAPTPHRKDIEQSHVLCPPSIAPHFILLSQGCFFLPILAHHSLLSCPRYLPLLLLASWVTTPFFPLYRSLSASCPCLNSLWLPRGKSSFGSFPEYIFKRKNFFLYFFKIFVFPSCFLPDWIW